MGGRWLCSTVILGPRFPPSYCSAWSKWLADCKKRERVGEGSKQASMQRQNQKLHHHFCSYPIGQNSLTWPHLVYREAGKCSLQLGLPVASQNSKFYY